MSFDSRLFRPRRSNSSSASSALVSVGVSMRRQDHAVSVAVLVCGCMVAAFSRAGARRSAACARCHRSGHGGVDALVGQVASSSSSSSRTRQAAFAGADVAARLRRLVDVEQRAPSAPGRTGRARSAADQRVVRRRRRAPPAPGRATTDCWRGHRLRTPARRAPARRRGPVRTAPAPAAVRRPGATCGCSSPTWPMRAAVELDARAAARVQRRVRVGHEARLGAAPAAPRCRP